MGDPPKPLIQLNSACPGQELSLLTHCKTALYRPWSFFPTLIGLDYRHCVSLLLHRRSLLVSTFRVTGLRGARVLWDHACADVYTYICFFPPKTRIFSQNIALCVIFTIV